MDPLQAGLAAFSEALETRFSLGIGSSEDAIRYTFFVSALRALECGPERLILEYPHPTRPGALIDAWVLGTDVDPAIALEFKFHRAPAQVTTTQPRTMQAGSVISDVFKLAAITTDRPVRRVFIYVTGPEMRGYFRNPANNLAGFFDLRKGETLAFSDAFLADRPNTFIRSAGTPVGCLVSPLFSSSLGEHFEVRAFEIEPT